MSHVSVEFSPGLAVTGTGSSVQMEDPVTETDVTVMWLPRLQAITPQGVQRSQGHGSKDRRRHAHLLNESQPLSCRFSDCAAGLFPSQICPILEVPRDPQGCTVLWGQNDSVVQVSNSDVEMGLRVCKTKRQKFARSLLIPALLPAWSSTWAGSTQ